jgi:DNA-binding response OmpR family regulator
MKEKTKWAFILDKDPFVRLSLNKILNKYGFRVEEIEDLSQLEKRRREIEGGLILAELEIEVLEGWLPLLKKWNGRFVLMTPLVTDELKGRLKKIGIRRIMKKPVEPDLLKRMIREISPPEKRTVISVNKGKEGFRTNQKGGEGT